MFTRLVGDRIRNGTMNENDPKTHCPIPIIDIKTLIVPSSSKEERLNVARQIGEACEKIGFFVITNHGVDDRIIEGAWKKTTEFFDLPLEEKMMFQSNNEEYPYGYEHSESLSIGKSLKCTPGDTSSDTFVDAERTNSTNGQHSAQNGALPPDLKETFSIGPMDPEKSGMPPRRFPSRPEGIDKAYEEYYTAVENLASVLLRSFALALDLREDWFDDKMDRHMCALRTLNYPNLGDTKPLPGQLRAGAHTDYGALTILKSGGPGLQVSKDGDVAQWVDIPHLPDAFIINLGDLMQRWTNDKWVSTLHRVIVPPNDGKDHRRQSMAFFVNINGDAKVIPIETCVDRDNPAKYGEIVARDYLLAKHLASMGKSSGS